MTVTHFDGTIRINYFNPLQQRFSMSIRSQRYIIHPPSACPPPLQTIKERPKPNVTFDTKGVERCAWGEILQTAPRSTSLFAFIEDLLEPGSDLVWRGSGPGRGTEMRRSFSGLFGRFFARSYLQNYHNFIWFSAIDGDNFHLSPHWRVSRKPGSKSDMPDWICAGAGELAIAEAKGSHQKSSATNNAIPGPLKTAQNQITGVRVQKYLPIGPRGRWQSRSVKGWGVMSRWGLTAPPKDPFLYVLDPETEGEALTSNETKELVQAIARTHVQQTAQGLGFVNDAGELLAEPKGRRINLVEDKRARTFIGVVMTPFGPLDIDLDRASALAAFLDDPELITFIGLEEELVSDFSQRSHVVPRQQHSIDNRLIVGHDGLIIAPIKHVIDRGPIERLRRGPTLRG